MNRSIVYIFFLVSPAAYGQTKELHFVKADSSNWSDLIVQAKQKQQFIFLDFYATWCGPCKEMDKNVFSQEEVINFLGEHFIPVKVDIDSRFGKQMKRLYKVDAYPTYLFLDESKKEIDRRVGKSGAAKFLRWIKSIDKP